MDEEVEGQDQNNDQVVDSGQPGGDTDSQELTINPAWSPILDKVPDSFQKLLIPELRKWDQGVQTLTQKVHSEYEPYKVFKDNQVSAEELAQAHNIWLELQNNPERVYQAMQEYFGQPEQGPEQQTGEDEDTDDGEELPFDIASDPRFQNLDNLTKTMAQAILAQHQQQEQAEFDSRLEQDLKAAETAHGKFDEDYVLARMAQLDEDADTAVKAYHEMVQGIITNHRNPSSGAPTILGAGGGTPPQNVDVSNLSGKDRRAMIVKMLQRGSEQE